MTSWWLSLLMSGLVLLNYHLITERAKRRSHDSHVKSLSILVSCRDRQHDQRTIPDDSGRVSKPPLSLGEAIFAARLRLAANRSSASAVMSPSPSSVLVLEDASRDPNASNSQQVNFDHQTDDLKPAHLNQDEEHYFEPIFHMFMKKYNRTYRPGSSEYRQRYQNFLATIRRQSVGMMANFHAGDGSPSRTATYGINKFSDLSPDEFRRKYLNLRLTKNRHFFQSPPRLGWAEYSPKRIRRHMKKLGYPLRWDWRDKGAVTPIRDQGHCGACYAVSTVGMIEVMRSLKMGNLTEDLSVQQVLDCSAFTHRCGGGDPYVVLHWLNGTQRCKHDSEGRKVNCKWFHKHKLALEKNYPTRYINQRCDRQANRHGLAQIKDYMCQFEMDELDMLAYIHKHGPVTVGVEAYSWQDYLGGIVQFNCYDDVNHAVVIVGYDVSGPVPYYIIKNSWGTAFGHDGYIYVRAGYRICGVTIEVCGATF